MLTSVVIGDDCVTCTYSGQVGLNEVLAAFQQYLTHSDMGGIRIILHDFSNVESFTYSEAQFSEMTAYALTHLQEQDRALRCVITRDEMVRRCFELYSELTGRPWHVFSLLQEALQWADAQKANWALGS